MKQHRSLGISLFTVITILLSLSWVSTAVAQGPVASVSITPDEIKWTPLAENAGAILTISGPDGFYLQQAFDAGAVLKPADGAGNALPDGVYTFEFMLVPVNAKYAASVDETQRGLTKDATEPLVQAGSFAVLGGSFVAPEEKEGDDSERAVTKDRTEGDTSRISPENVSAQDVLHYDDVIITGSLCVGFDCADGESFGFDTIILKEHNLRIYFNDTSYTASYPTNNWRIVINDSTNGGASYFGIEDADDGKMPFRIEAGAPSHSLYVEDYGRVGLGTSTPVVELHIKDSDTPTVRLEQDSSGGWTAQTWDVAGNESNFFIRDATNGSKLPFRIQPSTPSSTLCLKSDGKVGMGTWSPAAALEVEKTGSNVVVLLDRTDGATAKFVATNNKTAFGSVTNHKVQILANDSQIAEFDVSGNLDINGVLTENSNVHAKENFAAVDGRQVLARVAEMPISSWNFKDDGADVRHVGPMAQDFYSAFGLGKDEERIAPLDTNGVALAAIQGLNEIVAEKDVQIQALETRLTALERSTILPWLLFATLLLGVVLAMGKRLYAAKG